MEKKNYKNFSFDDIAFLNFKEFIDCIPNEEKFEASVYYNKYIKTFKNNLCLNNLTNNLNESIEILQVIDLSFRRLVSCSIQGCANKTAEINNGILITELKDKSSHIDITNTDILMNNNTLSIYDSPYIVNFLLEHKNKGNQCKRLVLNWSSFADISYEENGEIDDLIDLVTQYVSIVVTPFSFINNAKYLANLTNNRHKKLIWLPQNWVKSTEWETMIMSNSYSGKNPEHIKDIKNCHNEYYLKYGPNIQ